MSTIKPAELRIIDRVMGMEGGYVLDFSDRTFAQFFDQEMGVDIDNEVWHGNGTSKAKRLRAYLQLADDAKAAKVLRALDDYRLTASIQSSNPDGKVNSSSDFSGSSSGCPDPVKVTLLRVLMSEPSTRSSGMSR